MQLSALPLWWNLFLITLTPLFSLPPHPAPAITVPAASLHAPMTGAVAGSMAPLLPPPSQPSTSTTPRVGIQVGHWHAEEHAEELAHLRESYGTEAAGVWEVELNLQIAQRVVALLLEEGIEAELLPAKVPPQYRADAFVSLHADGGPGAVEAGMRGFKLAAARSAASRQLMAQLHLAYGERTGLPEDEHITDAMTDYYAFDYRDYHHTVSPSTPAVILEMGFLTSAEDRAILIDQSERVAEGIAKGILHYLRSRR